MSLLEILKIFLEKLNKIEITIKIKKTFVENFLIILNLKVIIKIKHKKYGTANL